MRKKIAAANWKMNLTVSEGEKLLDEILKEKIVLSDSQQAIFAVPFPYLQFAQEKISGMKGDIMSNQEPLESPYDDTEIDQDDASTEGEG